MKQSKKFYETRENIYLAIRQARESLNRKQYNRIMEELISVTSFQSSMSSSDERYIQLLEAVRKGDENSIASFR